MRKKHVLLMVCLGFLLLALLLTACAQAPEATTILIPTEPEAPETIIVEETPKIVVEIFPNPDYRRYHVDFEISQRPIEDFSRPLQDYHEKTLEEVGEVGSSLLRQVFTIPGVIEITIYPYELKVEKGKAFDWEKVEPHIIEALKDASEGMETMGPD